MSIPSISASRLTDPGHPGASGQQHIDPARMMQAMNQHHWMGCDIVLTDAGFHRIHDALAHESNSTSSGLAQVGTGMVADRRCAGVHTPVV